MNWGKNQYITIIAQVNFKKLGRERPWKDLSPVTHTWPLWSDSLLWMSCFQPLFSSVLVGSSVAFTLRLVSVPRYDSNQIFTGCSHASNKMSSLWLVETRMTLGLMWVLEIIWLTLFFFLLKFFSTQACRLSLYMCED